MTKLLAKDNNYMKMVVHLLRVGTLIDKRVSDSLKQFDITHVQFNILRILEANTPKFMNMGEIKQGVVLPTSDLTRLVDRLHKKGLVERRRNKTNRRLVEVGLTPQGQELIGNCIPEISLTLKGFYKDVVTYREQEILLNVLRRIK